MIYRVDRLEKPEIELRIDGMEVKSGDRGKPGFEISTDYPEGISTFILNALILPKEVYDKLMTTNNSQISLRLKNYGKSISGIGGIENHGNYTNIGSLGKILIEEARFRMKRLETSDCTVCDKKGYLEGIFGIEPCPRCGGRGKI